MSQDGPKTTPADIIAIAEHAIAHPETWVGLSGVSNEDFLAMLRAGRKNPEHAND